MQITIHTCFSMTSTIKLRGLLTSLLFLFSVSAIANEQQQLDVLADNLVVKYQIIDNINAQDCDANTAGGLCFDGLLSFSFKQQPPTFNWSVYFSHVAPIQYSGHPHLSIHHINGDLHRIDFKSDLVKANSKIDIPFKAAFWHAAKSDLLPNFFVTAKSLQARTIKSTVASIDPLTGLQVLPHAGHWNTEKQYKRGKGDQLPLADGPELYAHYQAIIGQNSNVEHSVVNVIPMVETFTEVSSYLSIEQGISIDAEVLAGYPQALTLLKEAGVKIQQAGIPVTIQHVEDLGNAEAYRLIIEQSNIKLESSTSAGTNYGLMTLLQLYNPQSKRLPITQISDSPRFDFRGMHIDVSRNYHGKQAILDLIQQMYLYKLNKLHLHLADDEGWRLEIPGLPELTEVGAFRCFDLTETKCLLPQLGNGPERDTATNGFLTVADYKEILTFAAKRNVEVIPSLDMPGHSRAAVKAMQLRYKKFIKQGESEKANEYLLSDFEDATVYSSVQFYHDNTINPCMDSTYRFVDKVIDELVKMHEQAGVPLSRYHMGADETAGAWKQSPICEQFINEEIAISHTDDLLAYFVGRMIQIGQNKGLVVGAWSDGLEHVKKKQAPGLVQANVWDTLFWGGHKRADELANEGVQTVLSSPDVLYFDFPYRNHPAEPGYYWASKNTDSFKVFQFMPENLPAMAELWLDRMGKPYSAKQEQLPINPLTGIQGQFWSELTRTNNQLEYMLYPRLQALAERAWHKGAWELPATANRTYSQSSNWFTTLRESQMKQDWSRFSQQLSAFSFRQLYSSDLNFRLPPPGAVIKQQTLHVNNLYHGLTTEFKVGDGEWQTYHQPIKVNGEVWVRSKMSTVDKYSAAYAVSSQVVMEKQ